MVGIKRTTFPFSHPCSLLVLVYKVRFGGRHGHSLSWNAFPSRTWSSLILSNVSAGIDGTRTGKEADGKLWENIVCSRRVIPAMTWFISPTSPVSMGSSSAFPVKWDRRREIYFWVAFQDRDSRATTYSFISGGLRCHLHWVQIIHEVKEHIGELVVHLSQMHLLSVLSKFKIYRRVSFSSCLKNNKLWNLQHFTCQ